MPTEATPLDAAVLQALFSDAAYRYDLEQGTVDAAAERIIYLTEDLVNGIFNGLVNEAGEAWGLILKSCGHIWGKRLALVLEKKVRQAAGREFGSLPVEDYLAVLEAYFARHGWGLMRFHLHDAERHGVVRANLRHSLFAASLAQQDKPVDYLVAGMLQALFERVANCPLGCVQVGHERHGAAGGSADFLLSAPERIEALAGALEGGATVDDALARLRAA